MKQKADVIVIGAGIVGLSTAYYLAKEGKSVIILEKTDGNDSCSYGNAGYIAPSHIIPLSSPGIISKGLRWMLNPESPFYIKPRLNIDLAKWGINFVKNATHDHVDRSKKLLADICLFSQDLHNEFAAEENIPVKKTGVIMQCLTEATLNHEKELAKMVQDFGIGAAVLDIDELDALDPKLKHKGLGAVHFTEDTFMDPRDFMENMKKALLELGVETYTNQEVIGFENSDGTIKSVRTANNEYVGDEVVLATGAFTPVLTRLMGNRLLIEAGKGYSVDYYNEDLVSDLSYILVEARVAITPLDKFVRVAGTMELAGINENINKRRVSGYLKNVADYLPDFKYQDMKDLPAWAGLRPCSPDGLPYIGRDTRYDNLIVAAGHAMIGFTLGPATGKLVTEIIKGETPTINIEKLAVNRF